MAPAVLLTPSSSSSNKGANSWSKGPPGLSGEPSSVIRAVRGPHLGGYRVSPFCSESARVRGSWNAHHSHHGNPWYEATPGLGAKAEHGTRPQVEERGLLPPGNGRLSLYQDREEAGCLC